MKPSLPVELSVVTVTYNSAEVLPGMLDSLFAQVDRKNAEVIAVDSGSTDSTVEYLRSRGDVMVISGGGNAGYGAGMNRGARAARGPLLLLSNPDVVFRPGSIQAMVDEIRSSPDLGGIGPLIELPTDPPSLCPLHRLDPGLYYGWSFFSGFMTKFQGHRWINWNLDGEAKGSDLPWIHGCCGLYRREALDAVGGFDERFFLYFEDADLGRSLRKAGWRLRKAPGARVLHLEGQSTRKISVPSRVHFMESWHKYLRKHHGMAYRSAAFLLVAASLSLQLLVQLAKAPFRGAYNLPAILAYLKAHLEAPFRRL